MYYQSSQNIYVEEIAIHHVEDLSLCGSINTVPNNSASKLVNLVVDVELGGDSAC